MASRRGKNKSKVQNTLIGSIARIIGQEGWRSCPPVDPCRMDSVRGLSIQEGMTKG